MRTKLNATSLAVVLSIALVDGYGQVLTPLDLTAINEVAKSNSTTLISYVAAGLSKNSLKLLNSYIKGKNNTYREYVYSDDNGQELTISCLYDKDSNQVLTKAIYILKTDQFEEFSKSCTRLGMVEEKRENKNDGRYWWWRFKTEEGPEDSLLKFITFEIKPVGTNFEIQVR